MSVIQTILEYGFKVGIALVLFLGFIFVCYIAWTIIDEWDDDDAGTGGGMI